jgi:hypothetical protein
MKTLKSTLLLLALGATTFFTSCKKEKDPDPRDAYVGTYEMDGDCQGNTANNLDLKIEKDPKSATGLIVTWELYELFEVDEVSAQIKSGKLVFDEAEGVFEDPDDGAVVDVELTSEGTLSGKSLSVEVQLNGRDFCEFEGDKK